MIPLLSSKDINKCVYFIQMVTILHFFALIPYLFTPNVCITNVLCEDIPIYLIKDR